MDQLLRVTRIKDDFHLEKPLFQVNFSLSLKNYFVDRFFFIFRSQEERDKWNPAVPMYKVEDVLKVKEKPWIDFFISLIGIYF